MENLEKKMEEHKLLNKKVVVHFNDGSERIGVLLDISDTSLSLDTGKLISELIILSSVKLVRLFEDKR